MSTNINSEDPAVGNAVRSRSKAEKKVQKALEDLGLKRTPGIERVTISHLKHGTLAINHPQVYMIPGSDSYMVLGDAGIEGPSTNTPVSGSAPEKPVVEAKIEKLGPLDESQFPERDIQTIMSQTGKTRALAVDALQNSDGDIVNAILFLSD